MLWMSSLATLDARECVDPVQRGGSLTGRDSVPGGGAPGLNPSPVGTYLLVKCSPVSTCTPRWPLIPAALTARQPPAQESFLDRKERSKVVASLMTQL